ncbi:hypothetical protein [Rouxiella sp. Mn2063]|uniref:hypothetical protein n=1 Tax=Rouxiella sp. Mn2063 TaxID=3395262 RepID=UPI003BCE5385
MPHINMKHFPSLSDEQRNMLASAFIKAVEDIVKCPSNVISVAFEPVEPEIWMQDVYENEILGKKELTHTFPNYNNSDEVI